MCDSVHYTNIVYDLLFFGDWYVLRFETLIKIENGFIIKKGWFIKTKVPIKLMF